MTFSRILCFLTPLRESVFNQSRSIKKDSVYLSAGITWLRQAQEVDTGAGFAHSFALKTGWSAAYPETTGYIAKTLLLLADVYDDSDLRAAALSACDWLIKCQQGGAIVSPLFSADDGIVFDTGQVLFGFIQAYIATGNDKYIEAAKKAGDWLVSVADQEGIWTKSTHLGVPHVYNVRVAWALLELHGITGQSDYAEIARSNINFALTHEENGWFDKCAFNTGDMPYTHNLGYATRGLLESHSLMPDESVFSAAQRSADHVLKFLRPDGFLPGQIGPGHSCRDSYVCLTGNCQFAIIWYKLYRITGLSKYLDAADRILDFVKSTVNVDTKRKEVKGAVAGSRPLWGEYARLSYPNWATKFFLDALLEKKITRDSTTTELES